MSSKFPIVPPFIAITKATEPSVGLANFDFRLKKWHIAFGVPGLLAIVFALWAIKNMYRNYKRTGKFLSNPFSTQ